MLATRSLEAGSNGVYSAAQAPSSGAENGSWHRSEQWATLASALDSTDDVQAAAGVQWLSQLLISAAEATMQAGQGKLMIVRATNAACSLRLDSRLPSGM